MAHSLCQWLPGFVCHWPHYGKRQIPIISQFVDGSTERLSRRLVLCSESPKMWKSLLSAACLHIKLMSKKGMKRRWVFRGTVASQCLFDGLQKAPIAWTKARAYRQAVPTSASGPRSSCTRVLTLLSIVLGALLICILLNVEEWPDKISLKDPE